MQIIVDSTFVYVPNFFLPTRVLFEKIKSMDSNSWRNLKLCLMQGLLLSLKQLTLDEPT